MISKNYARYIYIICLMCVYSCNIQNVGVILTKRCVFQPYLYCWQKNKYLKQSIGKTKTSRFENLQSLLIFIKELHFISTYLPQARDRVKNPALDSPSIKNSSKSFWVQTTNVLGKAIWSIISANHTLPSYMNHCKLPVLCWWSQLMALTEPGKKEHQHIYCCVLNAMQQSEAILT